VNDGTRSEWEEEAEDFSTNIGECRNEGTGQDGWEWRTEVQAHSDTTAIGSMKIASNNPMAGRVHAFSSESSTSTVMKAWRE